MVDNVEVISAVQKDLGKLKMCEKTCNSDGYCAYRFLTQWGWGCNHSGYCDFERPRDSRGRSTMFIMPKDNCLEALENLTKQKEDKSNAK